MNGSPSEPKKLIAKSHLCCGHASAKQLRRVSVEWHGSDTDLVNFAGNVLEPRDVCRWFDEAPHAPFATASTVSTLSQRWQVDLFCLYGPIEFRAIYSNGPFFLRELLLKVEWGWDFRISRATRPRGDFF